MSATRKETRARWTAVNQLSWALLLGIAQMLGGIIIETFDYRVAFLSTAVFYFLATIIIPFIREEKREENKESSFIRKISIS
jgi:MFS family permease